MRVAVMQYNDGCGGSSKFATKIKLVPISISQLVTATPNEYRGCMLMQGLGNTLCDSGICALTANTRLMWCLLLWCLLLFCDSFLEILLSLLPNQYKACLYLFECIFHGYSKYSNKVQ